MPQSSTPPNTNRPRPKQKLAGSNCSLKQRNVSRSRVVPLTPIIEEPTSLIKLSSADTGGPRPRQRKVFGSKCMQLEIPITNRPHLKQNKLSRSGSVPLEEFNTDDGSPPKLQKMLSVEVEVHNTDDTSHRNQEKLSESIQLKEVAPASTDDDPRPKQKKPSESIQLKEVAPANTDDDPRPRPKQKKLSKPRPNTAQPKQKNLYESRSPLAEVPNTARLKLSAYRSA